MPKRHELWTSEINITDDTVQGHTCSWPSLVGVLVVFLGEGVLLFAWYFTKSVCNSMNLFCKSESASQGMKFEANYCWWRVILQLHVKHEWIQAFSLITASYSSCKMASRSSNASLSSLILSSASCRSSPTFASSLTKLATRFLSCGFSSFKLNSCLSFPLLSK